MALAAESAVSIAFALSTRRLIRFRGALRERAVTSFEQLEQFGFGAADLIFYVPGLHGLGERDHHFRQKVQGLQMCLVGTNSEDEPITSGLPRDSGTSVR